MEAPLAQLVIGVAERDALMAAARASYPEECCGLLVGRRLSTEGAGAAARGWVTRVIPATNQHPAPRRRFELDPSVHIALLKELRAAGTVGGEELLGHYHSHPDAAAAPSRQDLEQANDPTLIWIIIGPVRGGRTDITAWRVVAGNTGMPAFEGLPLIAGDEFPARPKNA